MVSVSLLSLIQTSFLMGLAVAAPIGPINLEIMRRSLGDRLAAGLALGLGAVLIDVLYLTLFSVGLGEILTQPAIQHIFFIAGGLLLCYIGCGAVWEGWRRRIVAPGGEPASPISRRPLRRHFLAGLLMTGANPMTIAFWTAFSLQFVNLDIGERLVASAAVMAGCLSWVLTLVAILGYARSWLSPRFFRWVTIVGGLVVLYFGLLFLWRGLFSP